jgi:hypothetical protein
MATVKETCKGVPKSWLNRSISDIHIAELAKSMTEWQELAPFLDLSPAEEESIVERYRGRLQLQKREALRKWKEKNGRKATYQNLIETFCDQDRVDLAETLKRLLTSESRYGSASQSSVIDVFHGYLCDCYSDSPHSSTLQWPFNDMPCKFVELDLYDVPTKDDHGDALEHHKPIVLESLFFAGNSKVKRKVVLVEGVAGVGKTTLSWHACKEWAAGSLFKDVKLLIHVSLSDPTLHSISKLADLIPHHSEEMRESVAAAITDKRGKGVCFLLEGCDEAPPSLWESFLYRFIAGKGGRAMVPNAHIILTSRPGIPIRLASCLTGKVLIRGFQSLDQFFATRSIDNRDQLVEAVKMKPELYSLCHLPLNAVILVYLYDILKDNLPTTRTGLFDPLVRNFLYRHMVTRTTHKLSSIDNLPEDLPVDVRKSLSKVSKLAYKSILGRQKVVDRQKLTEFGLSDIDNALGFLQVHLRLTMYGASECYSFVHLSLQEYLAALYISQMEEHQQATAIKKVFDQNPLSPVLTFYAGLTGLTIKQARDVFLEVLNNPLDAGNIAKTLGLYRPDTFFRANPGLDLRRHILALINCIYETQDLRLIAHVKLPAHDIGDLLVKQSFVNMVSSEGVTRHKNDYVPFNGMFLYPTDCLSIGYFARHASSQTKHRLHLEFCFCPLGEMEMKALTQELKKPADKENVVVALGDVYISTKALTSLNTVFNPHSCLFGLTIAGDLVEDIQLAAKYVVEGYYRSRCKYLEFYNCNYKIVYHVILLLRCPKLNSLNLRGSKGLFGSLKLARLFSESLKFTQIVRLCLDNCNINDDTLRLLAHSICDVRCTVVVFEIDHNPYSDDALAEFLRYLLEPNTGPLTVLSVTHVSNVHRNLVRMINEFRLHLFHRAQLTIGCMSELSAKDRGTQAQLEGMALLQLRRDLAMRSPHH